MAEIALHNLTKRYGRGSTSVLALRDVTLNVRDGELLAIVGPSGCGKTTLLRLIAGLDHPTSGTINFDGKNVGGIQPFERHVAMVFQDFSLYPHMTARKNIAFALRQRKLARAEIDQRVREVAAALDFQGLLDRYPRELSGGERQRIALARALAVRPAVILLDEPLSNLDAPLRAALRREIKALHRSGATPLPLGGAGLRARTQTDAQEKQSAARDGRTTGQSAGGRESHKLTIIHVTHDQEEAMMLGDRIAVMRNGAIEQIGTPMEIYRIPANRFVAGFIGASAGSGGMGGAMNFLEGSIDVVDGCAQFKGNDGFAIRLDPDRAPSHVSSVGGRTTLGVRPEHVSIERTSKNESNEALFMTITLIEPLGSQMNVHLRGAGASSDVQLVGRIAWREGLAIGDRVCANIAAANVHFFDENGRRIEP